MPETLLEVGAPAPPHGFAPFWQQRYERTLRVGPKAKVSKEKSHGTRWTQLELSFQSTDDVEIRGWALVPKVNKIERGFVVLHGYGGASGPDGNLPFDDAVLFFPCLRGLGLSRLPKVSNEPYWHVLHNIDNRDKYIHGGNVEDVWACISALHELYPQVVDRTGLMGVSFGGGIGTLALPWDDRIRAAHFEVPSFGNHPLRISLPTVGSGAAVIEFERQRGGVLETLQFYDAATAARHVNVPTQIAAALFDPFVAPPGQFSIYNALPGPKSLFTLDAGHFDYPNQAKQRVELLEQIRQFFSVI